MSEILALTAPIAGSIVPLGEVPDPMFALGMMGDGIAVEPSAGVVHAPCAATVVSVHRRGHAVKLRADGGAEILVHVGLEAVALRGQGLVPAVHEGDRVAAGDVLIRFDLAALAAQCGLVTTPILVTNEDAFHVVARASAGPVEVGGALMSVAPLSVEAQAIPAGTHAEKTVVLEMTEGLHARPAALLAAEAKTFAATVEIALGARKANAKSPVSLLTLGSSWGSRLTVTADGADAAAVVEKVVAAIASGLGDPTRPYVEEAPKLPTLDLPEASAAPVAAKAAFGADERPVLAGVVAAPGLAIGTARRLVTKRARPAESGQGVAVETAALEGALKTLTAHVRAQAEQGRTVQQREIMAAHVALLDDPELTGQAMKLIGAGKSAGWAWSEAVAAQVAILRDLDNARLAERAADLIDLEQQVLTLLAGGGIGGEGVPPDTVIIADDLLPSHFMAFGDALPAAIVVEKGGRTSHVAILSASSGVPMLAAVGPDALRIPDGATVVVDGEKGAALVNPTEATIAEIRQHAAKRAERRAAARAAAADDCVMADGTRVPVYANVGSVADATRGVAFGAEGSGLVRTEFLFLERREAPSEAEQLAEYQAIADAFHGRPVIIRTLDVGGDKPIPYLKQSAEENPILGVRGVRVCQRHPELMRQQFRALLRVTPTGVVRVMLPMIADLSELRWARKVFDEERVALGVSATVQLGIMIEVPSAVALADKLAAEADFFSIGTNDLTQYVLAMDRGNTELAAEVDAFHPAVLRMIAQAATGAAKHGRPIGVCGGLASELLAAPILIGLGITSLSATRSGIPDLKAFIRKLDTAACRDIAAAALDCDTADAVRALVAARWPDA
jgi:phosphocarrier protein FPr/phosphocarrier protein